MKKRTLRSRRLNAWHLVIVVVVCLVTYGNSLSGSFVWDDEIQIVKNGVIRSFRNVGTAFTSAFWDFAAAGNSTQTNFYRPVQTLSYMLAYSVGELSPRPYHVITLAFHAIASVSVYLVCLELSLSAGGALLAAILFAVHPVHSEAVAWIAGVPDVACGAFYFAALWAGLKYFKTAQRKWLWFSLATFFAALLAKEMAVTLPLVAWILWRFQAKSGEAPRNPQKVAFAGYAAVLSLYVALRLAALGFLATSHFHVEASIIDWFSLGADVLAKYLQYSVLPYPLSAYHLLPLKLADRVTATLLSTAVIAILAIVFVWFRDRLKPYLYLLAAFVVMFIPVLYFPAISIFFAERYLYIPVFSIVLLAVAAAERLGKPWFKNTLWIVAAVFALAAINRNSDWENSERLYTRTLETDPDAAHIRINLSDIQLKRGEDASAATNLEKAIASLDSGRFIDWTYERYRAYVGLGAIAARAQDYPKARRLFEQAVEVNPNGDWGYLYLGGVLLESDRDYPNAIAHFKKAIQLGPLNEMARDYLGIALLNQKNYQEAAHYFEEALRINPNYADAKAHLALANRALARH